MERCSKRDPSIVREANNHSKANKRVLRSLYCKESFIRTAGHAMSHDGKSEQEQAPHVGAFRSGHLPLQH